MEKIKQNVTDKTIVKAKCYEIRQNEQYVYCL